MESLSRLAEASVNNAFNMQKKRLIFFMYETASAISFQKCFCDTVLDNGPGCVICSYSLNPFPTHSGQSQKEYIQINLVFI